MEDFSENIDGMDEFMHEVVTEHYAASAEEALESLQQISPMVGVAIAETLETLEESSLCRAVNLFSNWSGQVMALIFLLNWENEYLDSKEQQADLAFETLTLSELAADCLDSPDDLELLNDFACFWMQANEAYQQLLSVI